MHLGSRIALFRKGKRFQLVRKITLFLLKRGIINSRYLVASLPSVKHHIVLQICRLNIVDLVLKCKANETKRSKRKTSLLYQTGNQTFRTKKVLSFYLSESLQQIRNQTMKYVYKHNSQNVIFSTSVCTTVVQFKFTNYNQWEMKK